MKVVERFVDLQTEEDSNLFLRALWAELRKKHGRLGWLYSPRRDGPERTIQLGLISVGTDLGQIKVIVIYSRIGVISRVRFEVPKIRADFASISKSLGSCIAAALEVYQRLGSHYLTFTLATAPGLDFGSYRGRNWSCWKVGEGKVNIKLTVRAFDEPDARFIAHVKLQNILDALSFMTNLVYDSSPYIDAVEPSDENLSPFNDDGEWLDRFPVFDSVVSLQKVDVEFCDLILEGAHDLHSILNAARLYHKARKSYLQYNDRDLATALSLSALEAISLSHENSERCESCSQPVYSITQRLVDLCEHHLGPYVAKIIKEAYTLRSNFLHAGKIVGTQPLTYDFVPQLDRNGVEGCAVPMASGNTINVLEFTSFVLRKVMVEKSPNLRGGC